MFFDYICSSFSDHSFGHPVVAMAGVRASATVPTLLNNPWHRVSKNYKQLYDLDKSSLTAAAAAADNTISKVPNPGRDSLMLLTFLLS
jgi:hypothetical protein